MKAQLNSSAHSNLAIYLNDAVRDIDTATQKNLAIAPENTVMLWSDAGGLRSILILPGRETEETVSFQQQSGNALYDTRYESDLVATYRAEAALHCGTHKIAI